MKIENWITEFLRSVILFGMRPESGQLHPVEASHLHARRERVFLVFAGICLTGFVLLKIFLPETKGKTLEEIERNLGIT